MEAIDAGRLLTDEEIEQVRELLPEDWIEASVRVNRHIGGPPGLGLHALGQLADWSDRERRARVQDKERQAAQTAANLAELKVTVIGVVAALVLGSLLAWRLDGPAFLEFGFPVALGAWVLWSGIRAGGSSGGGWIALGVPLVLVSGLVIGATEDEQGRMATAGLPLLLVALVALSLGIAQALFGMHASYAAASPEGVRSARRARRVTAINLAAQAFIVQLAFYWMILRAGGLDEAVFNAAFRYLLFVPAMGVALALTLASSASQLGRALTAALLPPSWCLAQALLAGHGMYAFILQWALVDILVILLALPVGGLVIGEGKARSFGLGAGLAAAAILGLLAYGMVRLGALELIRIGALAGPSDFVLWIVGPALLTVISGIALRRPEPPP